MLATLVPGPCFIISKEGQVNNGKPVSPPLFSFLLDMTFKKVPQPCVGSATPRHSLDINRQLKGVGWNRHVSIDAGVCAYSPSGAAL